MESLIPISKPSLGEAEIAAVTSVLSSGMLTGGEEVKRFEQEFAEVVDGRSCLAINSGTSALVTCLAALGIGKGDEVIVPGFTFGGTANAVLLVGATPVFADIDPVTYCLCPNSVRERIGSRTAAILPVHLYGHPAPMTELLKVAEQHGLAVIEDAAQAHGASIDGIACGAFGDAAVFSFYATKNMTTGEGGMSVFKDPRVAEKASIIRNQGMNTQYQYEMVGFNFRMTDMAAAIGRVQLKRLSGLTEIRIANAKTYDGSITKHRTPTVTEGARHVYHQYTLSSSERDDLLARLRQSGIDARVYYPDPLSRFPVYGHDGYPLEHATDAAATVVSIPVGPHLSEADIARVVEVVES